MSQTLEEQKSSEKAVSKEPSLYEIIGRLAEELKHLSLGDIAELRRMDVSVPNCPVFYRLAFRHLVPTGQLSAEGNLFTRGAKRWAVILSSLAALRELHLPKRRLGQALAA